MQGMRKFFEPIAILISYHFYGSLLVNKGCKHFAIVLVGGWQILMGLFQAAHWIEFENPVVSFIHVFCQQLLFSVLAQGQVCG